MRHHAWAPMTDASLSRLVRYPAVTLALRHQLAQDEPQAEPVQHRVLEWRLQIHTVVVAGTFRANAQHPCPPQVTDDTPDGAPRQRHRIRNLADGTVRVDSDVEEDCAVAGNEIPVVL